MHKNSTKNCAIELTKILTAIDTSTPKGLAKARSVLTQWVQKNSLFVSEINNTNALYIQTNPNAAKEFSFVCHLDVVSADGWKEAFTPIIKNGALIARGVVDDKGPLAICLETMLHFRESADINVTCLIVNDEEIVNKEIGEVLQKNIYHPDFCLVADGGTHDLFDIGQKGIIKLSTTITTEGGHSAFEEFENNAALQMIAFIHHLNQKASKLPVNKNFKQTFINVSRIVSETVPYGMPSEAMANLEIQFPLPQTLEFWLNVLEDAKKIFSGLEIKIDFTEVPHLVEDATMLKLIKKMGGEPITVGGVNLAKDLNKSGIKAIGHCPVTTYMAHCDNESMLLTDFEKGVKMYKRMINQFVK